MRLNLPLIDALTEARSVLMVGMGGGFDIFCGLPIRHALRDAGKTVHLANLSFTSLKFIKDTMFLAPGVFGVHADCRSVLQYIPELYLARYLRETENETAPVWCLGEMPLAAQPLLQCYTALLDHLQPDVLLLVDGGVDSLIHGDEAEVGTVFEDAVSLAAVSQLPASLPSYVACLGMGAEDDITYGQVLENIATLTKNGGLLGTCSLTAQMAAYQAYESAVAFVHGQKFQQPSVINSSIVSAVRGQFGNYHATERTKNSRLHISPLMALYWFFETQSVVANSLFVPPLVATETRAEALHAVAHVRNVTPKRSLIPRVL